MAREATDFLEICDYVIPCIPMCQINQIIKLIKELKTNQYPFRPTEIQPSSDMSSTYYMLQPPQSWKTGALEIHSTFTVDSQF